MSRALAAGDFHPISFCSRVQLLTKKQGTEDAPFGTTIPAEQIKLFTGSQEAKLTIVPGGGHYLNATSPEEVNAAILEMVSKYGGVSN